MLSIISFFTTCFTEKQINMFVTLKYCLHFNRIMVHISLETFYFCQHIITHKCYVEIEDDKYLKFTVIPTGPCFPLSPCSPLIPFVEDNRVF